MLSVLSSPHLAMAVKALYNPSSLGLGRDRPSLEGVIALGPPWLLCPDLKLNMVFIHFYANVSR